MSSPRARLPVLLKSPAADVVPGTHSWVLEPNRTRLARTVFVVAEAVPGAGARAFAEALVEVLGPRAEIVDVADGTEGAELASQLTRGSTPVVLVGIKALALLDASMSVLITGSAPKSSWSPSARLLERCFHLVLAEPRRAVARSLVL